MEQQKDVIRCLRIEMRKTQTKLEALRDNLAEEEERLKEMCQKHEYIAEPDGDCHSPGWYYTCKHCGYWTKMRPIIMKKMKQPSKEKT